MNLFFFISYQSYVSNTIREYESYYASVIFAFLSSLGFQVIAEETTNSGRIDMTMIGPEQIYILEFKVDISAEIELHQMKTKRYYEYGYGKNDISNCYSFQ